MDISKIDKNFAEKTLEKVDDGFDLYNIPNDKINLYGVFYENGKFKRLPESVANSTNNNSVINLNFNTTGGRIRFSTNSTKIRIIAKWDSKSFLGHMASTGVCGFTLQEDFLDGTNKYYSTFVPPNDSQFGYESEIGVGEPKKRYFTLYFPLYNGLNSLVLALDKGSSLENGIPYKNVKPVLYYGSSITQGGCASRTDNSYPAMIAKQNNVDFINLGFAGGCKGEESIMKYMASLDVSLLVLDYDHNAPNAEFLKETYYKAYKAYRDNNPTTPILMISKPDYYFNVISAKERIKVIKGTYLKAKRDGDKNVYFLNGKELFKENYTLTTVDRVHPNDLGFYFMSKVIGKKINQILKI